MSNVKDSRNMAFAVGFGFTMGKVMAKYTESALDLVTEGIVKVLANKGYEPAQKVCKKTGLKYKDDSIKESEEIKMGFHV